MAVRLEIVEQKLSAVDKVVKFRLAMSGSEKDVLLYINDVDVLRFMPDGQVIRIFVDEGRDKAITPFTSESSKIAITK